MQIAKPVKSVHLINHIQAMENQRLPVRYLTARVTKKIAVLEKDCDMLPAQVANAIHGYLVNRFARILPKQTLVGMDII